jgi:hypothetical protein
MQTFSDLVNTLKWLVVIDTEIVPAKRSDTTSHAGKGSGRKGATK